MTPRWRFPTSGSPTWNDGSPMSWEDFECTWQANLNTPGSLDTTGWDKITSVAAGDSELLRTIRGIR